VLHMHEPGRRSDAPVPLNNFVSLDGIVHGPTSPGWVAAWCPLFCCQACYPFRYTHLVAPNTTLPVNCFACLALGTPSDGFTVVL